MEKIVEKTCENCEWSNYGAMGIYCNFPGGRGCKNQSYWVIKQYKLYNKITALEVIKNELFARLKTIHSREINQKVVDGIKHDGECCTTCQLIARAEGK